jgi:hypothetical protein
VDDGTADDGRVDRDVDEVVRANPLEVGVEHAEIADVARRERALRALGEVLPCRRPRVCGQRLVQRDPLPLADDAAELPSRSIADITPCSQLGKVTGASEALDTRTPRSSAVRYGHWYDVRSGPSTGSSVRPSRYLIVAFMFAPIPCRAIAVNVSRDARSAWMT